MIIQVSHYRYDDRYLAAVLKQYSRLHTIDSEPPQSLLLKYIHVARRAMASSNEVSIPTCRVVRPGEPFQGKQGLIYSPAISAETVGSRGIHMQLLTIPPGGRAKAHKHASHETAIYMLSGVGGMWYGPELEHECLLGPGEFLYIPADMPHLPYNASNTEEAVAIISRTDPNEQESVILLPHLEAIHP